MNIKKSNSENKNIKSISKEKEHLNTVNNSNKKTYIIKIKMNIIIFYKMVNDYKKKLTIFI